MSPQPGAASEPPNSCTASAAHSSANASRSASGQPHSVPSTMPAPNTSPAPVGSSAVTRGAGTYASSPVLESIAIAPFAPSVTTASGTRSASRYRASRGLSVPVYAIASTAFGMNAWQYASWSSRAGDQAPDGSQPT